MGLDSKTPFPLDRIYEMAEYPNYEPDPARGSIAARAALAGEEPLAYAYDVMMRNDGGGMIHVPLANYTAGHFDEVRKILSHPGTRVSLADGGAHLTRVADAATPTFMLMHWARDRSRGEKLPLEFVIRSLTLDTASSYGLNDRGRIAPGFLADINVIDFDNLRLPAPYRMFDLSAGGQRLLQRAEDIVATIKSGVIIFRDGEHLGNFPGRLVRAGS